MRLRELLAGKSYHLHHHLDFGHHLKWKMWHHQTRHSNQCFVSDNIIVSVELIEL